MAVFQINAVPAFIQLLSSPNLKLRDNSAWALGNIAGDCPQLRDHVISQGVLQPYRHPDAGRDPDQHAPVWHLDPLEHVPWQVARPELRVGPAGSASRRWPSCSTTTTRASRRTRRGGCRTPPTRRGGCRTPPTTNAKIQVVVNAGVVERLVELLGSLIKRPA